MKRISILLLIFFMIPSFCFAKTRYFYDIFEEEAIEGGHAVEYRYNHRDSFLEEPSKKIYYWKASYSDTEAANAIINKYNVIFGGYCWQMIRTTDTGGVKMIYNGVPREGKCNNTGANQQIGKTAFNSQSNSLADIGYMYNTRYPVAGEKLFKSVYTTGFLSTSYYYGDDIEKVGSYYRLINPVKVSSEDEYPNLVGKYTLMYNYTDSPRSNAYYITGVDGKYFYFIPITSGNLLSDVDYSITYGSSFEKDNEGLFHINNPTTIHLSEYYLHLNDMKNSYICENAVNNSCEALMYVKTPNSSGFYYLDVSHNYKYSSGFTYDENTGTYTLNDDDSDTFWNYTEKYAWLRTHHYTCMNEEGQCEKIAFVYAMDFASVFYMELSGGKGIEYYINKMLYADDVNQYSSKVKQTIDTWYANNLIDYTSYLEDAVFCNSRNFQDPLEKSGWHLDGSMNATPYFGEGVNFACTYETDAFSMSNPKAKLTYPIGLPMEEELDLLGNPNLRKTGEKYWMASYAGFSGTNYAYNGVVTSNGGATSIYSEVGISIGVRPVVSMKPKSRYASGDGSIDNPFIYDYNDYYNIDVVIKNETKDLDIEIDDITSVPEGEQVTFTVTPIKGFKITGIQILDSNDQEVAYQETTTKSQYTFIMPNEDVTIIPSYERTAAAVNVEDNPHTKEIKIEVNDATAVVYEDVVRFTVEAEEGYELIDIEITDEEGNEVEYHKTSNENEYEFIMPATDVLIKPIYREIPKEEEKLDPIINPNTGRSLLWIGILLVLGFLTRSIYKKQKMKV